ncbi:MAG: YabP/YqfC family sporulation protein [Erysipelotrichales bacterium]|nr:YabP/YqfC family sporulation protein [Erysipelotrichales bacterium]
MLDIIKSYFNKEDFYLIITNSNLYIKNYNKIINIEPTEIIININEQLLKINGQNLTLKRIVSKDLVVNGTIESVKYI